MSKPQDRYQPNPAYGGRKERQGFSCGPGTFGSSPWCVAVKVSKDKVQVRDTKDTNDTTLTFTPEEWRVFTEAIKDGYFGV